MLPQGNNDMVMRILNVGGDPLHTNNAGYASHSIAFNQGHQRTGEMVADAGCIAALNIGDYISAIALIREGASVNVYNPQGTFPTLCLVHLLVLLLPYIIPQAFCPPA